MLVTRIILTVLAATLFAAGALAQTDPSYPFLEKAYEALRRADYDTAIPAFEQAAKLAPRLPSIRHPPSTW